MHTTTVAKRIQHEGGKPLRIKQEMPKDWNFSAFEQTHKEKLDFMNSKNDLTPREKQILDLFKDGLTSKECSLKLSISYFTVETHRRNIHRKLGTHNIIKALAVS